MGVSDGGRVSISVPGHIPTRLPLPAVGKFGLVDSFRMAFSNQEMIFNNLSIHDSGRRAARSNGKCEKYVRNVNCLKAGE